MRVKSPIWDDWKSRLVKQSPPNARLGEQVESRKDYEILKFCL